MTWSPPPASGQGTTFATYAWAVTGKQTITITAANPVNVVSATFTTDISAFVQAQQIYLPLVRQ